MILRLSLLLILFTCNINIAMAQSSAEPFIKITKTPTFDLPIECDIGEDCWVMNYVDMGADDGHNTDPACQNRTYDNHKGTDFMILDEAAMNRGVNVITPLGGTVTKVRDGEVDRFATDEELEQTKAMRKECGNAVMIDHGENLQTIYCHLKQNSILVEQGQEVKIGDRIGQVGLSGLTQFPHLHFGIIKDKKIIDPFTGQDNNQKCGTRKSNLWNKDLDLSYRPILIQNLGFSDDIPALNKVEKNSTTPESLTVNSNLLSFWVVLLGVQEGDIITIEVRDPNDKIFAQRKITQDKTRARQFYYTGRRTTREPLMEGAYTGSVKIERDFKGQIIKEEKFNIVLIE